MASANALAQGLYNCGSYDRGHAYLREHAAEITPEFVTGLRGICFNFTTGEQPDSELAIVFAELTILAAVLLGDDEHKGMALYCKGSILARLERHREALDTLHEAAAYLQLGTDTKELANCLYDAALCYSKLGDYDGATRLLEQVLMLQQDQKERSETLAFLLLVTSKAGGAVEAVMHHLIPARPIRFVQPASADEKSRICKGLLSKHATRRDRELFKASIPAFLAEPDFHFFVMEDATKPAGIWPPYACGLLKKYRNSFNEWNLLALEVAWFADSHTAMHLNVIAGLVTMARDLRMPPDACPLRFGKGPRAGADFQSATGALWATRGAFRTHAGSTARPLLRVHRQARASRVLRRLRQPPGAAGKL